MGTTQEATHREAERSLARLFADHENVRQRLFDYEEDEADELFDKHKAERRKLLGDQLAEKRQLVTGMLGPVKEDVFLDLMDEAFYSLTPDQFAEQSKYDTPFFNLAPSHSENTIDQFVKFAEAPRKRQAIRLRKVTQ